MLKKTILFGTVAMLFLATLIAVGASRMDTKETAWRPYRYGRPVVRQYYGPGYYVPTYINVRPYYRDYYRPYYHRPYYSAPGIYVGPGHVHVGPVVVDY